MTNDEPKCSFYYEHQMKFAVPECYNCGKFKIYSNVVQNFNFKTFIKSKWKIEVYTTGKLILKILHSDCKVVIERIKIYINKQQKYTENEARLYEEDVFQYTVFDICNCQISNFIDLNIELELKFYFTYDYKTYMNKKMLLPNISQFMDNMKMLLEKKSNSDSLLIVKGEEFHVHKAILGAHSPVLFALFNTDMQEKKESKAEIHDITPEVMKQLLLYIYSGSIDTDIAHDLAVDLLIAADKYAVEGLKFICEKIISNNLSIENFFEVCALAENYKLNNLKKKIIQFSVFFHKELIRTIIDDPLKTSDCFKEEE